MISPLPIVAWLGPINLVQAGEAKVPGAQTINVTCTGDGSPTCGQIADGYLDADGRRLPKMLSSKSKPTDADVILGAFSAGGQIAKRIGLNAQDRGQVRAMMLSDAMYTNEGAGGPNEGYVRYAADASVDPSKLMVATVSSSPNKSWPSGSETMAILRKKIEEITGKAFQPFELPKTIQPRPVSSVRMGNVVFVDYGSVVSHGEHATLLAPQFWKTILLPWLNEDTTSPPVQTPKDESFSPMLALLGGVAIGYAGMRWLSTYRTRRGSIRL